MIGEDELHEEYIIPSVFNKAVVERWRRRWPRRRCETGVARKDITGSSEVTAIYR